MKIGIDARLYGPRTGGGGIGRYIAELVTHLQLLDHDNTYVIFLRKENFHECVIRNANFTKRMVDVPWYSVAEQRVMPREIAASGVQLMHYPHWNVPIFSRVPFVVTIHDLILLEDSGSSRASTRHPFIHGIKHVGFRIALEHAIHRSKHIISVSEYTKGSLLRHFRVRSQKISVIPNGVLRALDGSSVNLRDLGVYDQYFLYVGNSYPHKNLDVLLAAFAVFHRQQPGVQLVLAGRRDMFSQRLEKQAQDLGIPPQAIRFIDLPTDLELAALYKNAKLFIFPSRIEGFGIPPLEAMSYGTPVAAARAASIPEVLGNCARFFEPDDIDGLVAILHDALAGKAVTESMVLKGKRRAEGYRWKDTAQATLDTYCKLGTRRM